MSPKPTDASGHTEEIVAAAERVRRRGESTAAPARDPVNQPMVNNWLEAIGDQNPIYTDADAAAKSVHGELVAPPAMAQVWTMPGLAGQRADDDPLSAMMSMLDDAGFTSVVATNSEQTYHRYVRHGERVAAATRLENAVGPKRTGLGDGWFVTTRTTWYVGAERVAEMSFRVLKFRPGQAGEPAGEPVDETASAESEIIEASAMAAGVLRPVISQDNAFFWAGTQVGQLRIQRWGQTLRHPPGPMPPDGDMHAEPDYVVSTGRGEVYSYVVHHRPQVPGKELPFVIALVELEEGVRMLGELIDVDPEDVRIGLPVRAVFRKIDDELTLPAWRLAQ